MRAFRCAYASGGVAASSNLEDLALDFYEENCRGCSNRSPTTFLGDTIANRADAQRAAQQAGEERARAEAELLRRQRDERSARRSRRGAGEPYPSVAQLERVDRLDPPGGTPDATDVDWLTRTASLAPEVITDATIVELLELARSCRGSMAHQRGGPGGARSRSPLPAGFRSRSACSIALGNLGIGPGSEAGKLLVAASDALDSDDVTADVARSVIELAGRGSDPWARALSRFSGEAAVADPAPTPLVCLPRTSRPWSDSWRRCSPGRRWSLDLSCLGLTGYPSWTRLTVKTPSWRTDVAASQRVRLAS